MRYHFLLDFVYGYRNIGIIRAESGQNIVRDICRGIAEAQRLAVLMRNAEFLQQRVIIHQCPLGKIIKVLAEMVEIPKWLRYMFLPLRSNNGVPNSVSTFFSTMLSAGWVIKSAFDADVMFSYSARTQN